MIKGVLSELWTIGTFWTERVVLEGGVFLWLR